MASNTRVIDGAETIMFTSRSKLSTITLKAEPGKSLVVDGTSGGGGGTVSLSTDKTSTELGFYETASSAVTLTATDPGVASQGADVQISKDGNYILTVGPNPPNTGSGVVFYNNGSGFIEQFTFDSHLDSIAVQGMSMSINEDGTAASLKSEMATQPGNYAMDYYTRTGTTWTYRNTVRGGNLGQVSGIYTLVYSGDDVSTCIFKFNGAQYVVDTYLPNDVVRIAGDVYPMNYMYGDISALNGVVGSLVVYRAKNPQCIAVWTRSGTTWSETARLFGLSTDTNLGRVLTCSNNIIIAASDQYVYIWQWIDAEWILTQRFVPADLSSITRICIDGDGNRFSTYAPSTHSVRFYIRDPTTNSTDFLFCSSKTLTSDSAVAMSSNRLVVGKSSQNGADVYSLVDYAPVENITVNDIDLADQMHLTSEFPITVENIGELSESLKVIGDLNVTGLIRGSNELQLASSSISNGQNILNDTDIPINIFDSSFGTNAVYPRADSADMFVREAGYYLVQATCSFASNATGYRAIKIFKNDVTDMWLTQQTPAVSTGVETVLSVCGVIHLNVGDAVIVYVRQTSGGDLAVTTRLFTVTRLGA